MRINDDRLSIHPDNSYFGISTNEAAQHRLFGEIRKYLLSRGLSDGFSLGKLDQRGGYGLCCIDGYWVVAHNERGEQNFRAAFFSFADAADFLILKLIEPDRYKDLDLACV